MIGEVIAGLASTQATASSASDMPASCGERAERVDGVELALVPVAVLVALGGVAEREARALAAGPASRRCLPVSSPPAIGL